MERITPTDHADDLDNSERNRLVRRDPVLR